MGTVIVSLVLFVIVTAIVKSLCKKRLAAKKAGGCGECCGSCPGCGSCSDSKKNKS